MKYSKQLFITFLLLFFFSESVISQTMLSTTTNNGSTVGMEVSVDNFGHINNVRVGTSTSDIYQEVNWINYRSLFVKLDGLPLAEIKENAQTPFGPNAITPFDGFPASPTGTDNGYFFPDRYDNENWTYVNNVNEKAWHNVLEFEWDDKHIIGGMGYKVLDPSPVLGFPYVELRPAYQLTNAGEDTVLIEPFLYERVSQVSGGGVYSNANPASQFFDYDGEYGTSDDYVVYSTDPGITPLPYFSFAGFPLNGYHLRNSSVSILGTLQNSGQNYNVPIQNATVANPAEMIYQFDSLYLAPGQAGVYWLPPKPLKFWNLPDNYPTDIDYHSLHVKDEFGTYEFVGTDVSIFYSDVDFVTNDINGVTQDSTEVTVVEITGGMIESEVPENIGRVLDNRYWEVFYDTRRTFSVIHPTFNYDAVVDDILRPDSLTLLYRLDYDKPWTEWQTIDVDFASNTLTALSIPYGNIQFVLAEKGGLLPPVPELISVANGSTDLWYNPALEWRCGIPADYNLQLADNPDFINPIINNQIFANRDEMTYQLDNYNQLQDNTTYFWRVRANNGFGSSDFSETWSFTTSYLNWTVLPEITNFGNPINVNTLHFLNKDTGYVAGDGGRIRKTIDGGNNWLYQSNLVGNILNGMDFINDTTAFIVGSDATILKLQNGSWSEVNDGFGAPIELKEVQFVSSNIGYAVGRNINNSVILKTVDGGNVWNQLNVPVNGVLEDLSFINTLSGYVVGREGIILKTDNGGNDWSVIDDELPVNYDYYAVSYLDPNNVFVSGSEAVIIRSFDNGINWEKLNAYRETTAIGAVTYRGLYFTDNMNGFAVASKNGTYQIVLRTTNGGDFWGIQNSNIVDQNGINDVGLDEVHFPVPNVGYAVGYNGTAIKYTFPLEDVIQQEANVEIEQVIAQPGNMVEVPLKVMLSENVSVSSIEMNFGGFQGLADYMGIITEGTLIGDNNWIYEVNNSESMLSIAFAGSTEISGAGELFKLQFYIPENITADYIPIYNYGIIFDDGTIVVETTDGGIKVEENITYGDVDGDGSIRALDASFVLKYLTGAVSETEINPAAADVSSDNTISTIDASLILQYVVALIDTLPFEGTLPASDGAVEIEDSYVSLDELTTKIPLVLNNGNNIYGMYLEFDFNEEELTFEGIEDWNEEFSSALKEVRTEAGKVIVSLASSEANSLNGTIANLKFTAKEISLLPVELNLKTLRINEEEIQYDVSTSVISLTTNVENNGIPAEYQLSQNYPNPFNPTTQIKFSIPQNDFVSIKVFDILGNEVAVLINRELNAGYYNVKFNASNLTSGLYIYRVQTNNFTDVKKMMLIK